MRRILIAGIWIAGLITLNSCGYNFAGGGSLPGDIKTVHIAMLENKTAESGAEVTFTNGLIFEFTRNLKGGVVKQDAADAILKGTILSLNVRTISRTDVTTATQMRVSGTLSLTLEEKDGTILWKADNMSDEQAYDVDADSASATEANKKSAISYLSEKMAEKVYNQLTDDF